MLNQSVFTSLIKLQNMNSVNGWLNRENIRHISREIIEISTLFEPEHFH